MPRFSLGLNNSVHTMFEFWDTEDSDEDVAELIDKAANDIRKRGLVTPAIMAIEMHRPLANVGAHAAVVFAPFLVPFLGLSTFASYTRIFRKRENIEKLLDRLGEPEERATKTSADSPKEN